MERFGTLGRDFKASARATPPRRSYRPHLWTLAGLALGASLVVILLPDQAVATRDANIESVERLEAPEVNVPESVSTVASPDAEPAELLATPDAGANEAAWMNAIVASGDSLSHIFHRHGFTNRELFDVMALDEARDALTRILPGAEIRLLPDERGRLAALVHALDEVRTLHIRRSDDGEYQASIEARATETRTTRVTGTIEDSLFLSASRAGLSDRLIMELVRIFGWDIDFALDIRRDDRFTVVHEEVYADGEKVRDGRILAAEFENRGRLHRGIAFAAEGERVEYYSPDGKNLRKAFLRTPVEYTRVSSRFNPGRKHPVLNRIRAHKGVDYAAPVGTPVRATGDGRITLRGTNGGYGNTVIIQHGSRYSTLYAHLSRFARGLKPGDRVRQGQVIGYVGATGLATGPHLHYEFRIDGTHHDPLTVALPSADPLPRHLMAHFLAASSPLVAQLDAMQATRLAAARDE